jgi:hypothetical protein
LGAGGNWVFFFVFACTGFFYKILKIAEEEEEDRRRIGGFLKTRQQQVFLQESENF